VLRPCVPRRTRQRRSRDRLPLRAEDFSSNFKITRLGEHSGLGGAVDAMLPLGHTCFFTIDLPEYTTLEAMTDRVR